MDQNTRTVAAQPEEMKILNPIVVRGEPNLPKLQRVFRLFTEISMQRTVSTEEIDYNGHLNNSKYLDWVEELLDSNFYTERHQKSNLGYSM